MHVVPVFIRSAGILIKNGEPRGTVKANLACMGTGVCSAQVRHYKNVQRPLGPGTAKFLPEQGFAMGGHSASFPAFEARAS